MHNEEWIKKIFAKNNGTDSKKSDKKQAKKKATIQVSKYLNKN